MVEMLPVDTMFIPAHQKHRVAWTSQNEPTIWLTVHFQKAGMSPGGKPPAEKKEILIKRRMDKLDAEQKYMEIQKQLEHEMNEETKQDLLASMDTLKKQFITIKDEDIKKVKELLESYGVIYYVSPGEADQYCAHLIKQNIADGCISDDMDMFLYDCKLIVRHISLLNHTIVLYDCGKILHDLKLSRRLFCEIMVLSGTDYNLNMEVFPKFLLEI
jgi:5'-3' exonuclease